MISGCVGDYYYWTVYNDPYPYNDEYSGIEKVQKIKYGVAFMGGFNWRFFSGFGLGLSFDLGPVIGFNKPDEPNTDSNDVFDDRSTPPFFVSLGLNYEIDF